MRILSILSKSQKKRILAEIRTLLCICMAGLLYILVCTYTLFRVPCMFYILTGWKCPGCGITRMCLFLLRGNVKSAWEANQVLFILLPLAILFLIRREILYIKTGVRKLSRIENISLYVVLAILIIFSVIRNIFL